MPRGRGLRRRAARLICIVVVLVAAFLPPQASSESSPKEVRRVLILNVFDPLSSPGVAELDHGIIAGLESSPHRIELYTEDLEMTLFADEAHQQEFHQWYTHKYHDRKPDVIIAVGLEPLRFAPFAAIPSYSSPDGRMISGSARSTRRVRAPTRELLPVRAYPANARSACVDPLREGPPNRRRGSRLPLSRSAAGRRRATRAGRCPCALDRLNARRTSFPDRRGNGDPGHRLRARTPGG